MNKQAYSPAGFLIRGVPNDVLEHSLPVAGLALIAERDRFAALNAELVSACKAAREVMTVVFSTRSDGPGRQAYDKLNAVLAKCKP